MKRIIKQVAFGLLIASGMAASAQNELTIVRPTDPVALDPHLETTAPGSWVYSNILETLITLSPNMELEPRLATEWEFVDDNRLRFKLREDVTFHDGTPFNAEAVKFTWERAFNPDSPGRWASLAGPFEAVEVVDEYTVDIVTSQAYGPLLFTMTMPFTGIVSPTAVAEKGDQFSRAPVGTGPFKFVEWRANDRVVIEANDDYWRGRPELDRVVFRTVPEEGSRMLSLRTGEADMVLMPSPTDIAALETNPEFEVHAAEGVGVFYLGFNVTEAPTDNLLVRQALHHAIDRELLVEAVLEGGGTLATSVISPPVFGYSNQNLDELYPYDPERAIELLEEAGYVRGSDGMFADASGTPLVLSVLPSNGRSLKDLEIAEVLQEFFRQVGVGAELDVYEWATTFEIMRGAELPYNAFTFTWFTTTADADYTMYANYHSEETPPNSWNRWRYANEEVDALLEQARASLDPQERLDAYAEVQEILAQDVASVPLYNSLETAVVNSAVDGYVAHPIQYILDLYPVSINR